MRELPALLWYFRRELGSGRLDNLVFTNKWRLVEIENVGGAPVEYSASVLHEIEGALISGYTIQPRPLTIGVLYKGAKNQRGYFEGRRRLDDFIRPNQYRPVRLYAVLPSHETVFLEVYASPGAAMPLSRERGRTFLEPVNITAQNPIWVREETEKVSVSFGSVAAINVPNQAIVAISTGTGAVTDTKVTVDLSVSTTGSGGAHAGIYAEIKKTSAADSTYERTDVGAATVHEFLGLDDQTNYSKRAVAYNSGGDGSTSDVVTQITTQYVPPLAAPDLEPSATQSSITLTWTAVDDATGYRVRNKLSTDTNYSDWEDVSGTTYTLSGLETQVAYDFQVEASFTLDDLSTAYGTTASIQETTIFFQPPGSVRNLREISSGEWDWDAPNSGGPVSSYVWSWRGTNGRTQQGSTSNTSASYSGGSSTDTFRVYASGPGGNGPSSQLD